MSIKLVDSLQSMGDFPVAFANSIECADGTDLETKLSTLGTGGGAEAFVQLSQEEYDNLEDSIKLDGREFRTYDTGHIYQLGVEFGKETDISTKQDNLNQVKFTMRRNGTSEPRYCLIGSSDLSQNLLMCEPYRFQGVFGRTDMSVEGKSMIDLSVSFREGAVADKIFSGYANSSEGFNYVDLVVTVDDATNTAYVYVDFKTSASVASGEITKPSINAESYMDFAESFELVDTMQGVELCRMSDYCKVITEIDDVNAPSENTVYSSAKVEEKYGVYTFGTAGATQWLKLTLGNSSKFQPITITDQYGGKVEITGMADDGTYKSVKLVRYSYGDWTTYSATDYTVYDGVDPNYKIQRLYYYPTNGCYYLEIRQWCTIKVSGATTKPEMVTSLPAEASEMTRIPESAFATKKDIDGTTIQTTTTTGEEYYAITYGDDYNDPANQNILIQYKRSNFSPSTYILSAVSYATNTRETVSVAKISNNFAGSTYNLRFYVDKDNKTVYLRMPSYSSVSLQNLAFKSKAVTYTKVDSIPSTATVLAVAEYVTKSEMPTTRSLTLKSDYSGYITEVYDPTTKVVVYNINVSGTFKGLLNSVADGFRVPKGSTSSSDVMHQTIGMYGSSSAMTGDAQFTRLLVRNYGNPHLEVDVNAENTVVSGTITYVTT